MDFVIKLEEKTYLDHTFRVTVTAWATSRTKRSLHREIDEEKDANRADHHQSDVQEDSGSRRFTEKLIHNLLLFLDCEDLSSGRLFL